MGRVAHIRLHTADRARFTAFARERLAYTVLLSTAVPLTGHNYARVTGRRQPGTDRILWQVSLNNGTNAMDRTVRSAIAVGSPPWWAGWCVPRERVPSLPAGLFDRIWLECPFCAELRSGAGRSGLCERPGRAQARPPRPDALRTRAGAACCLR